MRPAGNVMLRALCLMMVSVMSLSAFATFHHHSHNGEVHTVLFALGHLNNHCMDHEEDSESNAGCNSHGNNGQECEFSTQLQKADKPSRLTSLPRPASLLLFPLIISVLPASPLDSLLSGVAALSLCRCERCIGAPSSGTPSLLSRRGPPQI